MEYSQEDYALNDLARDIAGRLSDDIVRQVHIGRLERPAMTLLTASGEYQEYKADEQSDNTDIELRITRLRQDLAEALGAERITSAPLADITRADANALSDHLLKRMKPSSVKRYITVIRAAVNYVIAEHTLNIPNVFNGLKIKGATVTTEDRDPINDQDLNAAWPSFQDHPVAKAIFTTLTDTGARLSEIVGLEV